MIYCTGDTHGDWTKFSTKIFPEQKEMSRDDFVIICGDFGLWNDNNEEKYWLKWLNDKPFTTLFVDGNHENYTRLNSEFETVDFHGGKAHKIRDNIYHLMRGYVFDICDKKYLLLAVQKVTILPTAFLTLLTLKQKESLIKNINIGQKLIRCFA